jgi:hypothetical protein
VASAKDQDVNCHFGPGLGYIIIGALKAGESVPVIGKSASSGWFQIQDPLSTNRCWVGSSATEVTGDLGSVPVVPPPVTFVYGVTVNTPPKLVVPGCVGPAPAMTLSATIEVNGPIKVTWRFATQQSGRLSVHNSFFPQAGSYKVSMSYSPPLAAGNYWLQLIVFYPNTMTGQADYKIACP